MAPERYTAGAACKPPVLYAPGARDHRFQRFFRQKTTGPNTSPGGGLGSQESLQRGNQKRKGLPCLALDLEIENTLAGGFLEVDLDAEPSARLHLRDQRVGGIAET